jgi:hypothetical protein
MAAIKSLMTRDEVVHQLAKRQNWAAKEPGVIVVFCIVGVGMSCPLPTMSDNNAKFLDSRYWPSQPLPLQEGHCSQGQQGLYRLSRLMRMRPTLRRVEGDLRHSHERLWTMSLR